jgi:hypothetical protein
MSGSDTMLRELFRGLETTIHERLNLIEQVVKSIDKPKVPLYDNEFIRRIERLEESVAAQADIVPSPDSLLEERLTAVENAITEILRRLDGMRLVPAGVLTPNEHVQQQPSMKRVVVVDVPTSAPALAPTKNYEEPEVVETNLVEDEDEDEQVEEELVEEEQEEEGGELEELEWNGQTYGVDSEGQVYQPDEEGNVDPDHPVGKWNGRKIIFYKH